MTKAPGPAPATVVVAPNVVSPVPKHHDKVGLAIIGAYIVVTAAVPYQYGQYFAPALVVALVGSVLQGRRIPVQVMLWIIVLGTLGAAGATFGSFNGNPGVLKTLSVFLYEPVIIGLLVGSISSVAGWRESLIRSLDWALITVGVLGFLVYVASRTGVQVPTYLVDTNHNLVDLENGKIRTAFQGYNALVFLAPYGILRYFSRTTGASSAWRIMLLVLSLSGLILAGKRALYLSVPLALVIAFLLFRRTGQGPKVGRLVGRAVGMIVALGLLSVVLDQVGLHFVSAFTRTLSQVTLTDDSDIRHVQSSELLSGWASSPLWGHGAGAALPHYFRSADSPWVFELSYHVILFNFGLIGLTVLAAWNAWIGVRLIRDGRQGSELAQVVLCGWISTLVVTAVDPYLFKIDGMWMIFVPFGVAAASIGRSSSVSLKASRT